MDKSIILKAKEWLSSVFEMDFEEYFNDGENDLGYEFSFTFPIDNSKLGFIKNIIVNNDRKVKVSFYLRRYDSKRYSADVNVKDISIPSGMHTNGVSIIFSKIFADGGESTQSESSFKVDEPIASEILRKAGK